MMTLDELVGNLKTYEMNMDEIKKDEVAPKKTLALKVYDSDNDAKLDEKQVAFITHNFSMFFKRKNFNKKGIYIKKRSNDSQTRCYKYDKTDHQIRYCPLQEIEWRKDRAKKKLKQKAKKGEKEEYAMIASWGSDSEESNNDDVCSRDHL